MSDAVDVGRVTDWLVAHTPPLEPPLSFEQVAAARTVLAEM